MDKKNILLITTDFPPQKGGIASWAYAEYKILQKSHNPVIIDKSKLGYKQQKNVIYFKNNKELIHKAKKICNKHKIKEVIFFHWEIARLLYLWLKIKKIPYIIILHGWEFLQPRSIYTQFIKKLILDFSNEVRVASPYLKNKVLKYKIPEDKIKIVPIPINRLKFKQYSKDKRIMLKNKYGFTNKKIIISVGRLVERKNFFTVLESIKFLIKNNHDILYIIVGNGPIRNKLEKYIAYNQLENNTLLMGEVSEKKLIELYNISDLFVLTPVEIKKQGNIEGFGIVYHEAHYCGLPVIGSDTGGVKYALSLISNSYIIKERDCKNLARLIEKILF